MWIRHVLVPGITDKDEYLIRTREFIDTLKTVTKVEVLPYHTLGAYKWKELGIKYGLEGVPYSNQGRSRTGKKDSLRRRVQSLQERIKAINLYKNHWGMISSGFAIVWSDDENITPRELLEYKFP